MNNFAPVFIITLNRYEHFRRCVESLSNCTYANDTELYVFIDFPKFDYQWNGYTKILEYVYKIEGFRSVNVIRRKKNYGASENYYDAKRQIFSVHDTLIFTEDDNEFSPLFLKYMNSGLELFREEPRIYAICGYRHPFDLNDYKGNKYFFSRVYSAWGVGLWKNKSSEEFYTPKRLYKFISNLSHFIEIYQTCPIKIPTIYSFILKGKPMFGDMVVSLDNIKFNRFSLFPIKSLVRNHGHDGSSLHSQIDLNSSHIKHLFEHKELDSLNDIRIIESDRKTKVLLRKYFNLSLKNHIYSFYLFMKIYWRGKIL